MKPYSVLFACVMAAASASEAQDEVQMEGMAVIGNSELPKALFIVPWKDPEAPLAAERPVNSLINDTLQPVDPDVFRRRLEYFETVHKSD
jgi:hypothetical protein